MQIPKKKRYINKKYRTYISSLECHACGMNKSEAHHENWGFPPSGTGKKTDDTHCLPLCVECHHERHSIGPVSFWGDNPTYDIVLYIRGFIGKNFNVDPDVLMVELLTDWLREKR